MCLLFKLLSCSHCVTSLVPIEEEELSTEIGVTSLHKFILVLLADFDPETHPPELHFSQHWNQWHFDLHKGFHQSACF